MSAINRLSAHATTVMGIAALTLLLLSIAVLETLRPKMVIFQPLTASEEWLLNVVGVGLLITLAYCVLASVRIIRYSVRSQHLSLFHLTALASGTLTFLFVFADVALISDIGKQYQHGLSQPEWIILYIVVALQMLAVAGLVYVVGFTLDASDDEASISHDSSVFLVTNVVGVLSAGTGLAFTVLNFFFPRPLQMIRQQMIPTLVVVLIPFVTMTIVWAVVVMVKRQAWLDEKQRTDVGAAAAVTLVASTVMMGLLYGMGFVQESGMVSVLWFPYFLFFAITIFTASVLYRSRDSFAALRGS